MISSPEVRTAVALYVAIAITFCVWLLPQAASDPDVKRSPGIGVAIFVLLVLWPFMLIGVYIRQRRRDQ